jgi:hypothetical protein
MDGSDLKKLREKYSRLTDEELKELLLAGKSEFEPEAFTLLVEEARKRQVELAGEVPPRSSDLRGCSPGGEEREIEQESYVELIVVNHPDDVESNRNILTAAAINFYFQPMSYSGKELPVALFVLQQHAGDAVELFNKNFQPKFSIVLF